MPTTDPRVDAYIANAQPFARPILERLRALVHETCPEVEETIKWSSPFFLYRGLFCHMAAFRQHCAFGFWKWKQVVGADGDDGAMGEFGRLATLSDLPPKKVLTGYLRKAMALNEAGVPAATHRQARVAQTAIGRAGGSRRGAAARREGARDVRRIQPEPPARVRRMDRRGQARGNAREAAGGDPGVAGRRQAAELEIPALSAAAPVTPAGASLNRGHRRSARCLSRTRTAANIAACTPERRRWRSTSPH